MGIYIPGMEMPESCEECPCLRQDRDIDGFATIPYQCNITLGLRKKLDGRPKWCPLVERDEED